MNVAETLAALQEAGISLRVQDTSIVASPSSRPTNPLRAAIRENKPKIISALSAAAAVCSVQIVELPAAERYRKTFALLQVKPPALVDVARWQQCIRDGSRFLAKWGEQAEALGWTSADLFGLHTPPERPHPTYSRLSRYDSTGLCWLLQGRPAVALTEATATIKGATGNITVYRRHNKPALGPLGDSLEDFKMITARGTDGS